MWFWLAAAIIAEVTGTIALRLSEGFSRLVPSIVVIIGYGVAFVALSQALVRGMPVGVAYGVWSALGVTLVAIIGAVFLGESLSWVQVGGIALVIGGVLALELGGRPT
jgi:small multidrug resistance pump